MFSPLMTRLSPTCHDIDILEEIYETLSTLTDVTDAFSGEQHFKSHSVKSLKCSQFDFFQTSVVVVRK